MTPNRVAVSVRERAEALERAALAAGKHDQHEAAHALLDCVAMPLIRDLMADNERLRSELGEFQSYAIALAGHCPVCDAALEGK